MTTAALAEMAAPPCRQTRGVYSAANCSFEMACREILLRVRDVRRQLTQTQLAVELEL